MKSHLHPRRHRPRQTLPLPVLFSKSVSKSSRISFWRTVCRPDEGTAGWALPCLKLRWNYLAVVHRLDRSVVADVFRKLQDANNRSLPLLLRRLRRRVICKTVHNSTTLSDFRRCHLQRRHMAYRARVLPAPSHSELRQQHHSPHNQPSPRHRLQNTGQGMIVV
jgi:hypothetical protein